MEIKCLLKPNFLTLSLKMMIASQINFKQNFKRAKQKVHVILCRPLFPSPSLQQTLDLFHFIWKVPCAAIMLQVLAKLQIDRWGTRDLELLWKQANNKNAIFFKDFHNIDYSKLHFYLFWALNVLLVFLSLSWDLILQSLYVSHSITKGCCLEVVIYCHISMVVCDCWWHTSVILT